MYKKAWCTCRVVVFANLRACIHGGGRPQLREVTCGGSPHLSCKRDQIKMRDYMDRRVTPRKRIPHLHANRPLTFCSFSALVEVAVVSILKLTNNSLSL